MGNPKRARSWKRRIQPRVGLKAVEPVLYSTPRLVATNHLVRRPPKEALGITFKVVSLRPKKFLGIVTDWIEEQPFSITDKEKTIIDGLDLPKYVGGVGEIAKELAQSWRELNEEKLREYAVKISNTAVGKRLGFLMEALGLGNPETLRSTLSLRAGFSPLDPTLPRKGKHAGGGGF